VYATNKYAKLDFIKRYHNSNNGTAIDRWVITELTASRLVFKFQFDVDSDGELELFKAICNRYEPPVEIDIYSELL
jgi:hypothetical protein